MEGAPWQGLFYAFVLQATVGIGALVFAVEASDGLTKVVAWLVLAVVARAAYRTVRRAARQGEDRSRPTGRWWFGG